VSSLWCIKQIDIQTIFFAWFFEKTCLCNNHLGLCIQIVHAIYVFCGK
jgi:hypothetical protein